MKSDTYRTALVYVLYISFGFVYGKKVASHRLVELRNVVFVKTPVGRRGNDEIAVLGSKTVFSQRAKPISGIPSETPGVRNVFDLRLLM